MKYMITLLLVLYIQLMTGIEYFSEDLDCFTEIVVLINTEELMPKNPLLSTKQGLLRLSLLNKSKIKYSGDYVIDYSSFEDKSLQSEFIPYILDIKLEKGSYDVFVEMFDSKGYRHYKDENTINVKRKKKMIAEPYIYTIINKNSYLWSEKLIGNFKETVILYRQASSFEPDIVSINDVETHFTYSNNIVLLNVDIARSINSYPITIKVQKGDLANFYKIYPQTTFFFFKRKFTPAEQFRQLKYILNENEIKEITTEDEIVLVSNIEHYWEANNPEPYSSINEYQKSFYERVLEADKRYSVRGYMDGWKTDMGKIYIKYGEPDEIIKEAFPENTKPYEIWTYFNSGKQFVFFDKGGDGVYLLKDKNID